MKVDFDVTQSCSCTLDIINKSNYPEVESYQNFLYKDSVTITIVVLNEIDNPQLVAISHNTHSGNLDEVELPLNKDGHYTITQLIVPTLDWYKRESKKERNNFFRYDTLYISDGKNLYKATDSDFQKVDELDFIYNISLNKTTISKSQKDLFLTCFLWKCYISLAKEVFDQLIKNNKGQGKISKCGNENEDTKDLIYRRDFVWATINVINYLIDDCNFEEAQKILEEIVSCNGFCQPNSSSILYHGQLTSDQNAVRSSCGCKS